MTDKWKEGFGKKTTEKEKNPAEKIREGRTGEEEAGGTGDEEREGDDEQPNRVERFSMRKV